MIPYTHQKSSVPIGLEGVPAAQTALSFVDGQEGKLILCGEFLDDFIATQKTYEEAAARFWSLATATDLSGSEVARQMGQARETGFNRLKTLRTTLAGLDIAEGLRLCFASLAEESTPCPHILLAGAAAGFVPNLVHLARGRPLCAPDAQAPHTADFLSMLHGKPPTPAEVTALETYLKTVMDHGMNASTFTARVIASTQAGLTWAITGAYCALRGPLHGGAPEPVLEMIDAIGSPEKADAWIAGELEAGRRLMGFGHRVYRVRDPRADVLKKALAHLEGNRKSLSNVQAIEQAALKALRAHKPDRVLETNVEFYTAMLLDALEIPREAFTAVFAMGRVTGWTAHALEQYRTGKLIRPSSTYTGPCPGA